MEKSEEEAGTTTTGTTTATLTETVDNAEPPGPNGLETEATAGVLGVVAGVYVSRGRAGAAVIKTTETAVVDKPAEEDEHAGHHHGHAH